MQRKTIVSVIVCLILAVAHAFAEDGSAEETIFTSAASPQLNIIYTVPRSAMLQPINLWDPLKAPCPADLQLSANKAKEHLLKTHNIKALSLLSIQLVHKAVFLQEGEIPSNTRRFVNSWYMIFRFQGRAPTEKIITADELSVCMLLDGRIATQKVVSGQLTSPKQ